jgi:hypothetical protein
MNALLAFGIIFGFFFVIQWAAAWIRESVQRALDLLPSLLHDRSNDPLAVEIDPPCGDVTYAGHLMSRKAARGFEGERFVEIRHISLAEEA